MKEEAAVQPGKKRSSERRERRHAMILGIATELFIEKGFHATTTEDIARKGAFSVGLIYRHFSKKEDILFAAIQSTSHRILSELPALIQDEPNPLRRFFVALTHYHRIDIENKQSSILGVRESKSLGRDQIEELKRLEKASTSIISDCIEACIAAGAFRAVDVEMLTYQVVMHVYNWSLNAWRFSPRRKPENYLRSGLDNLLRSVISTEDKWKDVLAEFALKAGAEQLPQKRPARKRLNGGKAS
jgi:TetR/AcrR family transcriptional regulator, cholesterol catabolism regulator